MYPQLCKGEQEWDVLIRDEAGRKDIQSEYVRFLCGLFKGAEPMKYISLAYITGILPMIKFKTQSALNNFDGLKTAIMEMYSGSEVEVNVGSFQNNISSFSGKDDVLTYLIHLGYLGYDQYHRTAFIPNEEIRQEFQIVLKEEKWDELHQMEKKTKVHECVIEKYKKE